MKKGTEAIPTTLILLFIVIFSGVILYGLSTQGFSTLKDKYNDFIDNFEISTVGSCKKSPTINYTIEYDAINDFYVFDASSTKPNCIENIIYYWGYDRVIYNKTSDLCGNLDCSIFVCEECNFGDEVNLTAVGNVSKRTSTVEKLDWSKMVV